MRIDYPWKNIPWNNFIYMSFNYSSFNYSVTPILYKGSMWNFYLRVLSSVVENVVISENISVKFRRICTSPPSCTSLEGIIHRYSSSKGGCHLERSVRIWCVWHFVMPLSPASTSETCSVSTTRRWLFPTNSTSQGQIWRITKNKRQIPCSVLKCSLFCCHGSLLLELSILWQ